MRGIEFENFLNADSKIIIKANAVHLLISKSKEVKQ